MQFRRVAPGRPVNGHTHRYVSRTSIFSLPLFLLFSPVGHSTLSTISFPRWARNQFVLHCDPGVISAFVFCSLWDTSCTTEWIERALHIDRDINLREIRKQGMRIWVISYTAHVYRLIYIHSLIMIFVVLNLLKIKFQSSRNASLIFPSYFSIILNLISLHHVF